MSAFTVRVELHSEAYADFEALHIHMAAEGFSKTITADDGTSYYLPRAEYDIYSSQGKSSVLQAAKRAVNNVGKAAEILVTESAGRTWSGLSAVR